MQRTAIDSDQIRSIGFDSVTKVMEIEFPRGSVYQYRGPKVEEHYAGLMQAAQEGRSVGSYFNQNVRGCSFTEYIKGEFPAITDLGAASEQTKGTVVPLFVELGAPPFNRTECGPTHC